MRKGPACRDEWRRVEEGGAILETGLDPHRWRPDQLVHRLKEGSFRSIV